MKKTCSFLALTATLFCLPLLTGCGTTGSPITKTEVIHPVVLTNSVGEVIIETKTNTVYAVNTNWINSIEAGKSVNEITNPTPTAPLINLALSGLAATLGWVAHIKNRKAQGAEDLIKVIIDGVEKSNQPTVKSTIQTLATNRGLEPELDKRVKQYT